MAGRTWPAWPWPTVNFNFFRDSSFELKSSTTSHDLFVSFSSIIFYFWICSAWWTLLDFWVAVRREWSSLDRTSHSSNLSMCNSHRTLGSGKAASKIEVHTPQVIITARMVNLTSLFTSKKWLSTYTTSARQHFFLPPLENPSMKKLTLNNQQSIFFFVSNQNQW